ncbi:MAG: hypothetical protein ACOVQC_09930 [Flavobacterium sp.]
MKKIKLILICFFLFSCRSYIDKKSVDTEHLELKTFGEYNCFISKPKINIKSDGVTYKVKPFSLNLPKNIKSWEISTNEYYFEYRDKQVILIYLDFKNDKFDDKWTIENVENKEIHDMLYAFWSRNNHPEEFLYESNKNRISKIYSNEGVKILLYNIKKKKLDEYINAIKTFKYR